MEDYQAWNYTKNGIFSVKSAYHLRMSQKRLKTGWAAASSPLENHKAWLSLWGPVAPGKVKTHMWRLIRNGLAVGSELHLRRINVGVFCVVCGREGTNCHRFWGCCHSVKFWKIMHSEVGVPVAIPRVTVSSQSDLSNWIMSWIVDASDDEKAIILQGDC